MRYWWVGASLAWLVGCGAARPADGPSHVDVKPEAPSSQTGDGSVTFAYSPERVGDVCDEWGESAAEQTLTDPSGKEERYLDGTKWHVQYEVLEVRNGVSTKERVLYDLFEVVQRGEPQPAPPTIGKPWVMALEGVYRTVYDSDGARMSIEDEAWARKQWSVGRPERYGDVFDGSTLRPRDPVPKLAAVHDTGHGERVKRRYTFEGRRGDDALIRYELAGLHESEGLIFNVAVTGSLWVSIPRGTIVREESKKTFTYDLNGAAVRGTETTRYKRTRSRPASDTPS